MPLGKGYTVEEQLTGHAKVGGIQFDFFDYHYPMFDFSYTDSRVDSSRQFHIRDVNESAAQQNLVGSLSMRLR